ncbi:unnamed protein product [Rotaria sordida]|uniref:TRPM SLOG domain-containing protein n=2 Tax=Rotaria sordida TaxID=392033 RepID=A0A815ESL7_9BILA|nr:unnamed protein product [Rotaria sordida]
MNLLSGRNSASNDSDLWSDAMDRKEDTKSYGILPQLKRPYLRCDIKTELDQLCLVLLGVWDTPVPGLIMRMMSDVDSTPNIKIQKEFLQAISDAAVASDAWIITSGYKEESISELIGEIVYKSQIKNPEINFSAIAVGKWGNIHDCHKLEDRSSVSQYSPHKGGHGRYKLESNHTHYIFFDDGTCDSLDTGEFASNLAREISRGARRKIPLITILVGGTLHAISSIFTDLQKQIPIVIVEGSGQLADILCKYLKLTESFYKSSEIENQVTNDQDEAYSDHEDDADITMVDEKFSQDDAKNPPSPTQNTLRTAWRLLGKNRLEFANDVRKLYSMIRQEEYEAKGKRLPVGELLSLDEEKFLGQYLLKLATCLTATFRENICVFNINTSKSLKHTIYHAFVQARDNLSRTNKSLTTINDQVHLALRWSIADASENQLVTTTRIWNDTTKIAQNRLLLIDALSKNLLVFVGNFVKLDIDITVLFGPASGSSTAVNNSWSRKHQYLKDLYSETRRKNTTTSACSKRRLKKNGIDYTDNYGINETVLQNFFHFHNRPIVKYCYTCFGYALFLLFFSYYMLYAFDPPSNSTLAIHWTEVLTIIIVTTMLFEEVRQFFSQDYSSLMSKIYAYFDLNNRVSNLCLVLPSYLLFYVGLALRFTQTDPEHFAFVRIVMACDLELWYIRSILFIGSFDSELEKLNGKPDSNTNIATHVLFAFHMLFVNILLINLLIALFSFTITDIQTQARYIWAYDCCDIIRNYHARPALFPPFTFLISIVQWCQWCLRMFYRNCSSRKKSHREPSRCFKMIPIDDTVDYAWSEFERYSTNDYIRQLLDVQATDLANAMNIDITFESSSTNADESKRIQLHINDLQDDIKRSYNETGERLQSMENTITEVQSKFAQMDERSHKWLRNMKDVNTALDWIMQTMKNAKMSESTPPLIDDTSRANPMSQRQQLDIGRVQSNPYSSTADTKTRQVPLQQERSTAPDFCIEIANRSFDDDSV